MTQIDPIDSSDPEFLASCYLDGQLDDTERRAFERRLEASPELGACLKSYTTIDGHLQSLTEAPPLDWERFGMQVGDRWRRELRKRRHGRLIRRFAGLAAAAVLGILVTRMALDWPQSQPTPPRNAVPFVVVGPPRRAGGIRFSHGGPLVATPQESQTAEERSGPMIIAYVAGGGV
ncbi:MAG: hypothetical protein IID37_04380 [Planctomycetes bacterium]|nr:hypothetical protein [Planctomycetota bacterium]